MPAGEMTASRCHLSTGTSTVSQARLEIGRRVCRLTGGDLTVTGSPGQGSTFTARLPAVVSEPATATT